MRGVGEAEDEFVDDAVDADGAGDEAEGCVGRVAKDEVVRVEMCEAFFADAAAGAVLVVGCVWGEGRRWEHTSWLGCGSRRARRPSWPWSSPRLSPRIRISYVLPIPCVVSI